MSDHASQALCEHQSPVCVRVCLLEWGHVRSNSLKQVVTSALLRRMRSLCGRMQLCPARSASQCYMGRRGTFRRPPKADTSGKQTWPGQGASARCHGSKLSARPQRAARDVAAHAPAACGAPSWHTRLSSLTAQTAARPFPALSPKPAGIEAGPALASRAPTPPTPPAAGSAHCAMPAHAPLLAAPRAAAACLPAAPCAALAGALCALRRPHYALRQPRRCHPPACVPKAGVARAGGCAHRRCYRHPRTPGVRSRRAYFAPSLSLHSGCAGALPALLHGLWPRAVAHADELTRRPAPCDCSRSCRADVQPVRARPRLGCRSRAAACGVLAPRQHLPQRPGACDGRPGAALYHMQRPPPPPATPVQTEPLHSDDATRPQ